jgi:hypothetical protein
MKESIITIMYISKEKIKVVNPNKIARESNYLVNTKKSKMKKIKVMEKTEIRVVQDHRARSFILS